MMIMKKLFKSLFVVIAATATFAGCQKEENNAPATETKTIEFFANSIETKTHFGDKNDQNQYPVYWDAADKVKVLLNIEQVSGTENTPTVTPSDDFASARFVADITDPSTAETPVDSYTFYSVSPSSAYNGKSSKDGRITVKIPAEQTPLETSVDKAAQVLYAVSETTATMPSSVNLDYHHLTAYGKFSLTNLTSEVSTVSKIQIIAPEDVYMSGKWNYMVEDGSIVVHTEDRSNNIIINTSKTSDIWFACAPVDASGKDVKIVVTTDQGDLEKTVRFPKKFESGKIATFTVNMDGVTVPEPEETTVTLTKVTSVSQLTAGRYIIVSSDDAYYLPNAAYTSSNGPSQKSTTKINGVIQLEDDMIWNVTASGSGYVFESASVSGHYLVAASDGTKAIRVNTTKDCVWKAAVLSNNVGLMSSASATRYLCAFGTTDWRYYASSNVSGSNKLGILYKVTNGATPEPEEPETPVDPTPDPDEPGTGGGETDEPVVVFYESFDSQSGTGGNSGGFKAASNTKASITGWTLSNVYVADKCVKAGGGSSLGSAETPALGQSGDMTLTFRAAAWDNSSEQTTLNLSISGGGTLSVTTVTMSKTAWTDYTVTITGATASTKIKFAGKQNSGSRFFLDEVKVVKN